MNKKYLTRTIVFFVLSLVVAPANIIGLFISTNPNDYILNPLDYAKSIQRIAQVAKFLNFAIGIFSLTFLGLGVYNLIKLLGDEETLERENNNIRY